VNRRVLWSKILAIAGSIAVLVGAIDPLEGSALILPGSLLVMLAAFIAKARRSLIRYRVWAFILVSVGVAAMWGFTSVGGIGGSTGLSMWWGVFVIPYLIGLPLAIWGPELPRWLYLLGFIPGIWYLAMTVMILKGSHGPNVNLVAAIVLPAVGLLIIGGCTWRLMKSVPGITISPSLQ
jgi:hypothetical protein